MGHVPFEMLLFMYLCLVVVVAMIESIGGRLGFPPAFRFGPVSATLNRASSLDTTSFQGVDRLELERVNYRFPMRDHCLFTYTPPRKVGKSKRITHGFKGEITWADGVAHAEGRLYVRFLLALPMLWLMAVGLLMSIADSSRSGDGKLVLVGIGLVAAPLLALYYQRKEVEKELATVLDLLEQWAAGENLATSAAYNSLTEYAGR
ncbi:MAG: hypothetical protein ABIR47_05565 [Candidatus Kapaibacterium sp.]